MEVLCLLLLKFKKPSIILLIFPYGYSIISLKLCTNYDVVIYFKYALIFLKQTDANIRRIFLDRRVGG